MIGNELPNAAQHTGLRRTDDIHRVVDGSPPARRVDHLFVQPAAVFERQHFEIRRAGVGREGRNHGPLALVAEERLHRIASHIGRKRHGIDQILRKERPRVHLRRIADVAPLGVGDKKDVGIPLADVADRLFERRPALRAVLLVKGEVRLVAYGIGRRRIDDGAVEGENGIVLGQQMPGKFIGVGVQPHAQEAAFAPDVFEKFVRIHGEIYFPRGESPPHARSILRWPAAVRHSRPPATCR